MSKYTEIIRESIRAAGRDDRDDQATAELVEAMLRDNRSGLDALPRAHFHRETREILGDFDAAPGFARYYAEAAGLDVPEWAKAGPKFDPATVLA